MLTYGQNALNVESLSAGEIFAFQMTVVTNQQTETCLAYVNE